MKDIRETLIKLTRTQLDLPLPKDKSIIHCIKLLEETNKSKIQARLLDWYSYYDLEAKSFDDIPESIKEKNGDLAFIIKSKNQELEQLKKSTKTYLTKLMDSLTPKLTEVTGYKLGALLISKAGSLRKLAFMASSKIQIIGAEKSLFKHMKTGSKSPKHGIIFIHKSIKNSENKGKAARKLAASIVKAARIDYFRK